jgi:hypothetical protein
LKAVGEAESELVEQRFLFGVGFGDAAQADFAAIGGGEHDIGTVQIGEQGQDFHRRERLGVIDSAESVFEKLTGDSVMQNQ